MFEGWDFFGGPRALEILKVGDPPHRPPSLFVPAGLDEADKMRYLVTSRANLKDLSGFQEDWNSPTFERSQKG